MIRISATCPTVDRIGVLDARCSNGHTLKVTRAGDGSIRAVATVNPYTETWVFVDAAFCPECGGEIVT